MTSQITAPSHPEKNCLGQPLTANFRVLAGWLLKFPVASQHPLGRDAAPPDVAHQGRVRALVLAALQL